MMKYKNFEEFKSWFQDEVVGINDNKVLHDIVINLDVFGPKKNIVDNVEFIIKGDYSNDIIRSVYENAVNNDQKMIEIYIEKIKTGNFKDYEITVGCLIGFVTCIYSNYFILEVAAGE